VKPRIQVFPFLVEVEDFEGTDRTKGLTGWDNTLYGGYHSLPTGSGDLNSKREVQRYEAVKNNKLGLNSARHLDIEGAPKLGYRKRNTRPSVLVCRTNPLQCSPKRAFE